MTLRRLTTLLLFVFVVLSPNQAFALRIISLKPNITLTLTSLGFASDIVGITKFCPRPNPGAEVVADYMSIAVEKIIRLKPDIVLSSNENSQSRQYEILQQAGLNVKLLNFKTLDDFFLSLDKMGSLLSANKQATELATKLHTELASLKTQSSTFPPKNFTVIVQRKPLMVAAGGTYISTLLSAVGWKNTFAADRIMYPVLDEESFLRANSGIIFDMSYGADWGEAYLGKSVTPIMIDDFLAAPQSIDALINLIARITKDPHAP